MDILGYNVVFVDANSSSATNIIALGAFGSSPTVFAQASSTTTAYMYLDAGGAYWYNYPGYGFGFAASSTIDLDICDLVNGSSDCQNGLCWRLDEGFGGYRAGCTTGLNDNPNWRKVIYGGGHVHARALGIYKI